MKACLTEKLSPVEKLWACYNLFNNDNQKNIRHKVLSNAVEVFVPLIQYTETAIAVLFIANYL